MNILFIPCIIDGAAPTSASVRFRAQWPARYWPGADVYPNQARQFADYDGYVFQKAYLSGRASEMIGSLRARDKLLAFDMCDADWLQSTKHEERLLEVLPLFDFAVSPTKALQEWLARWVPAYVIPDRLDLEVMFERRYRCGHKPLSVVWFGYSHNLVELDMIWSDVAQILDEYDLPLTIISDCLPPVWQDRTWGKNRKIQFVTWTPERADVEISTHTIALVPQSSPYKSNNRTITAWALGLQTATSAKTLEKMLSWTWDVREIYLAQRQEEIRKHYDVHLSVKEWRDLFEVHRARQSLVRNSAFDHKRRGREIEEDRAVIHETI